MALTFTPRIDLGWEAIDFYLPATDGSIFHLGSHVGKNGMVVAFICNHCPYVQSTIDRLNREAQELEAFGITMVGICSSDVSKQPDDSFDAMKQFADEHQLTFPYVHDSTQEVALSWGAVCTPDYYGFNGDLQLQYRGRLDQLGMKEGDSNRELFLAMMQVMKGGHGPEIQYPSMGCSIKWMDMHVENGTVERLVHAGVAQSEEDVRPYNAID